MIPMLSFAKNLRVYIMHLVESFRTPYPFYPELSLAGISPNLLPPKRKDSLPTLKEIIDNGFLWGVPKSRRSLEKRMTRRMGFNKLILPKNNIIMCEDCGHFHPVHTICSNCYEKVKVETEFMQKAVMDEFKLDPIEEDVIIVYENDSRKDRSMNGKRIIELPKERPQWFCENLMMKDSEIPRKKTTSLSETVISPKIENV